MKLLLTFLRDLVEGDCVTNTNFYHHCYCKHNKTKGVRCVYNHNYKQTFPIYTQWGGGVTVMVKLRHR